MKGLLLTAAVVLAPASAFAADLSGAWKIDSSVGKTPITVNCTLVQTGQTLSGACTPAAGNAGPTAFSDGTVSGSTAAWGYDVIFAGKPAHVGFTADITSDTTMTGVLSLAGKPLAVHGGQAVARSRIAPPARQAP